MSTLQGQSLHASFGPTSQFSSTSQHLVGCRAKRQEALQRSELIDECLAWLAQEVESRDINTSMMPNRDLKRFAIYFAGGVVFPKDVFLEALKLDKKEVVNGRAFYFSNELLGARDTLVMAYEPLSKGFMKLRLTGAIASSTSATSSRAATITQPPSKQRLEHFLGRWAEFENRWLSEKENHAVEALMPLVNSILALEPLKTSQAKEAVLPYPRVQHQRAVTLKCLEGFMKAYGELATSVLSSLKRELHHDARLLVLASFCYHKAGKECDGDQNRESLAKVPVFFDNTDLSTYVFKLAGAAPAEGGEVKGMGVAAELLRAFDEVCNVIMSFKTHLEECNPSLEDHTMLVEAISDFEKSYKRAKKRFLEPDNLV